MGARKSRRTGGLEMIKYGCNTQGSGPRGKTTRTLAQDGWTVVRNVRQPVMVEVETEWLPMRCGKLQQAGLGRDKMCEGCENEVQK